MSMESKVADTAALVYMRVQRALMAHGVATGLFFYGWLCLFGDDPMARFRNENLHHTLLFTTHHVLRANTYRVVTWM